MSKQSANAVHEPVGFSELLADVAFLLHRSMKAGTCSFHEGRETGISSNSIVAIAYGSVPLGKQELPIDRSDLNSCEITWHKLPAHRRTAAAKTALDRARAEVERRYPKSANE